MKLLVSFFIIVSLVLAPVLVRAQTSRDSLLTQATLHDCIEYALKHQPILQESQIDEDLAETAIKTKLSEWLPQVNLGYNLQHYLELPTSFFPDSNGNKRPTKVGVKNTSTLQLSATQNIFTA